MGAGFKEKIKPYLAQKDTINANRLIMRELGNILVSNKQDFADLLTYSGIPSYVSDSDSELVDRFIDNIHHNRRLLIGASYLVHEKNKTIGFDGEPEISDNGVKETYKVMYDYFDVANNPDQSYDDDFYNVGGAIAGALQSAAQLGSKIAEGQQKKKYGAMDMLQSKQKASSDMVQSIMAQRQAETESKKKEAEAKAKTTRTALIIGGSLLGVIAIITVIVIMKKRSKK